MVRLSPSEPRQIVAATRSAAFFYDAVTKALLREYPLQTIDTSGIGIGDIDGNGVLELVACDETGLFVHDFQSGAALASNYSFDCRTLAMGQLDGDSALEIAVTGGTFGTLVIDGATLSVQWADLPSTGSLLLISGASADANDELLYQPVEGGEIRAFDVDQNSTVWLGGGPYLTSLSRGDLNGDGDLEIIVSGLDGIAKVLDELDGAILWTIDPEPFANGLAAALADVDFDGDADLVMPLGDSQPSNETIAAFDVASSAAVFVLDRIESPIVDLATGDLTDPPTRFVATASSSGEFSWNGPAHLLRFDVPELELAYSSAIENPEASGTVNLLSAQLDSDAASELCVAYSENGGGIVYCEDGQTHEEQWRVHLADGPVSIVAADLELDGSNEVLIGTSLAAVYALDGEVGWLRWRTEIFWDASFSVVRVGNVDLDAALEVIAGGSGSGPHPDLLMVFDAQSGALEWGPHLTQALAFDVGQIDQDEVDEVVIGTEGGEVRVLDPITGSTSPPLSDFGQTVHSLRIADLDRDGVADLAVCAGGRLLSRAVRRST